MQKVGEEAIWVVSETDCSGIVLLWSRSLQKENIGYPEYALAPKTGSNDKDETIIRRGFEDIIWKLVAHPQKNSSADITLKVELKLNTSTLCVYGIFSVWCALNDILTFLETVPIKMPIGNLFVCSLFVLLRILEKNTILILPKIKRGNRKIGTELGAWNVCTCCKICYKGYHKISHNYFGQMRQGYHKNEPETNENHFLESFKWTKWLWWRNLWCIYLFLYFYRENWNCIDDKFEQNLFQNLKMRSIYEMRSTIKKFELKVLKVVGE